MRNLIKLFLLPFSFLFSFTAFTQSDIQLYQIDFADSVGNVLISNSSFGYIELDVPVNPTQILFLNIIMEDISAQAQWTVQNYPIFPESMTSMSKRRGLDFDITMLGLEPGFDLPEIIMGIKIDTILEINFPIIIEPQSFVVDNLVRISYGGAKMGNLLAPLPDTRPFGCLFPFWPTDVILHDSTAPVQEANNTCLAGAFARSLDWLNRKHNLGSAKTAQQWYQCLRDAGVSSDSTTYEADVAAKDSIFKALSNKGKTKVLDKDNALGPVPGVAEETATDVVQFICDELPNRDMELHYDTHIVTVTGKFKIGTDTYIFYRDDEEQGDDTKGDKAEKIACISKDSTGDYRFRGDGGFWKVKAVFSEYIDTTTSVSEGLIGNMVIRAFPNPSSGLFTFYVESPGTELMNIHLTDMEGRQILNREIRLIGGENQFELNLSSYMPGLYFLRIEASSGKAAATLRLIKL